MPCMKHSETLKKHALSVPNVLVPRARIDLSKWAVIACDQFTQDRAYWKKAADCAGTGPSTLNIILPEVYLEDGDRARRLESIRTTMREYLGDGSSAPAAGVFAPPVRGFVYIERKTAYGRVRKGLIAAIDLDAYDWKPDSKALIRATEATIVDRIPPRMEIRRGAPIESPHIMLLVNDPGTNDSSKDSAPARRPASRCTKQVSCRTPARSPDGNYRPMPILKRRPRRLKDSPGQERLRTDHASSSPSATETTRSRRRKPYGTNSARRTKTRRKAGTIDLENHPARYALVEIVNLYDDGLTFEPIHRVLFGTTAAEVSAFLAQRLGGSVGKAASGTELERLVAAKNETRFGFVAPEYARSPRHARSRPRRQQAPARPRRVSRKPTRSSRSTTSTALKKYSGSARKKTPSRSSCLRSKKTVSSRP